MMALEEWILAHPYLFRIVGPIFLFWILWIPFGNRLIYVTKQLRCFTQEAWKGILREKKEK